MSPPTAPNGAGPSEGWFAIWGTAHQGTATVNNQTRRIIFRATGGGDQVRIKLRNYFGTSEVTVAAANIAVRDTGASVVANTVTPLTFNGSPSVVIPAGEDRFSDPVAFNVTSMQDLAVTFFVPGNSTVSQDSSGFVTTYQATGDQMSDAAGTAFTASGAAVPLLEEVSVHSTTIAGVIVAAGGSVTDGTGSTVNGYDRFTDWLAQRMHEELPLGQRLTVINEGIGGNTTTNVIDRFDRDVLDKTGITHVIIYAGTNDLSASVPGTGQQIIDNDRLLIQRSHERGLKIIIATVTPRVSYTAAGNVERRHVNDWLRRGQNCSGECDGIVDFDAAIASTENPNQIDPAYDTDTIHPNGTGYGLMVQNFNLAVFSPACPELCSLPLHPVGPGSPGNRP